MKDLFDLFDFLDWWIKGSLILAVLFVYLLVAVWGQEDN